MAAAGCGNSDSVATGNLTKVTLNEVAHSIFYAPQYVAIENGYFAEEGIDLDLVTGFGADKTMTAVLSGEADIGSTAAAFSGGQGDFTVEFEPGASTLEKEGKGCVVASLGVDSGYVPYEELVTTEYAEKATGK